MTNDILALSKIEAGKMEYYMKDIEIVSLLTSIYNDIFLEAKDKQVKIEIKVDKNLKEKKIHIDEDKIKQVFINLI
ncbi:MAG: cell wall metabolism sensor histidine kinase WalK [Candidatus Peribacteria bacterium]|jgi:signal transduction histidine kinase|nr:cell wall metabolism sensor histidine kinase WalK [Candidatus Peribacteria bacterium]